MGTKTYSASFSMPKTSQKNLFKSLMPQTKPYNLKYPDKKRKWRIRKKWFNRYEKKILIGSQAMAVDKSGNKIYVEITSVKLTKNGMDFETKPKY